MKNLNHLRFFLPLFLLTCVYPAKGQFSNYSFNAKAGFIFDWQVRGYYANCTAVSLEGIVPSLIKVPHPIHDHSLVETDIRIPNPGGILLDDDQGDSINAIISHYNNKQSKPNFVFDDFENGNHLSKTQSMVDKIHQLGWEPYIGSYNDYAGTRNNAAYWEDGSPDRSALNQFYLSSGLNISMPVCYPSSEHRNHTCGDRYNQHSPNGTINCSPNDRYSQFWAAIETYSLARRNLPIGHTIIPYVAGFLAIENYPAKPLERVDMRAMIQHIRLRGADGYYRLVASDVPLRSQTNCQEKDAIECFNRDLDHDFMPFVLGTWLDNPGTWCEKWQSAEEKNAQDFYDGWASLGSYLNLWWNYYILNLTTNRESGIMWSAVRNYNYFHSTITLLVSNLRGSTINSTNDLSQEPELAGLLESAFALGGLIPSTVFPLSNGEHKLITFNLSNYFSSAPPHSNTGFSDSNLSVSPNPANSNIKVALNAEQENIGAKLDVIDVLDRVVLKTNYDVYKGDNSQQIDIQGLTNGIYYIVLKTKTGAILSKRKFIKN